MSSAYVRAAQYRGMGWYGIRIGDKQLRVWGILFDNKLARNTRMKDFVLNRYRISPFNISKNTVQEFYKIIGEYKPKYIYGYTSGIYRFCKLMMEDNMDGEKLGIRYVFVTAETLYDQQRKCIENFFKAKVVNEYGCSEMGPIAYECPAGSMHISMENVLVEFVDENKYGDGYAELILTNLNSYSMPMIRYRVGDTGQKVIKKCSCGVNLETMNFNAGRVLSTMVATDGHYVHGGLFCYIAFDIIEKYRGIKDFRVIQKANNKIEITLAKDINYNENILQMMDNKIKEILGSNMQIDHFFVDEIPLEKSVKRLFVRSELDGII
jgi:phenylacetate-CoA ligase